MTAHTYPVTTPYSLPSHADVSCCDQEERTVHVMEDKYGWCQRCGMLYVFERGPDGPRWIYNHKGK